MKSRINKVISGLWEYGGFTEKYGDIHICKKSMDVNLCWRHLLRKRLLNRACGSNSKEVATPPD